MLVRHTFNIFDDFSRKLLTPRCCKNSEDVIFLTKFSISAVNWIPKKLYKILVIVTGFDTRLSYLKTTICAACVILRMLLATRSAKIIPQNSLEYSLMGWTLWMNRLWDHIVGLGSRMRWIIFMFGKTPSSLKISEYGSLMVLINTTAELLHWIFRSLRPVLNSSLSNDLYLLSSNSE